MPHPAGSESRWDERVERARALAAIRPAAAEALTFYAAVAEYQKALVRGGRAPGAEPLRPMIDALDLEAVLGEMPAFLVWLPRVAPGRLAESAADLRRLERDQWLHLVRSYLAGDDDLGGGDHVVRFVLEAVLQPFVEQAAIAVAARRSPEPNASGQARCPFCNALPVVGVLREAGHGAKRTLVCALCLMERDYVRVLCPSCGEQQFDVLPVYTADDRDYLRIEACDHCHRYLKTIDLTKDGLAVPLVDDIASVSLDLWARDRGYVRLRANLLGL
jgi:formate dehydrogenase accessory protein FdhE